MVQGLIGLMMIRDEEDMLREALANHVRFCDWIFVLDGTRGDRQRISEGICRSYPEVVGYWRDGEIGLPLPIRDGARQFLLDQARAEFGFDNPYAILHGDELWCSDPRPVFAGRPAGRDGLAVRFYHFFPHISQRETWEYEDETRIEALATWYMKPAVPEVRLFWDLGEFDYPCERHSITVPPAIDVWQSELVIKQYNYRSPEQARARAEQRRKDEWQFNHYEHLLYGGDFFVETLDLPGMTWAACVPPGQGTATNLAVDPLPSFQDQSTSRRC